jgi:hypothetical protein
VEEDDMTVRVEEVGTPGSATVAGLLAGLDGLESLPLTEQAERLETVRKGLDEALAAGTRGAGHG